MTPSRLFPSEHREDVPLPEDARGKRVFRVTDRTINERTRIVIAQSPDKAAAPDATEITTLGRANIFQVVECVELVADGQAYSSAPERS